MVAWYNEPKADEKFASANINFAEANELIKFNEFAFRSDETFYYLFFYATEFKGLQKIGTNKDWKFEPGLIQVKIAKIEEYQKYDFKNKKQVATKQTPLEQLLCTILGELDESKFYQGKLKFSSGGFVDTLISGVNPADNKPLTDDHRALLLGDYRQFIELTTEPVHLKLDDLKIAPKAKSYGSSSQTELARIQDREKYILQVVKKVFPTLPDDFCIYRFILNPTAPHGVDPCDILMIINNACKICLLPQTFGN